MCFMKRTASLPLNSVLPNALLLIAITPPTNNIVHRPTKIDYKQYAFCALKNSYFLLKKCYKLCMSMLAAFSSNAA